MTIEMTGEYALKSCPFCGDEAILCISDRNGDLPYKTAYVRCKSCGCRSASFIIDGPFAASTTAQDAVKSWNRRHKTDDV